MDSTWKERAREWKRTENKKKILYSDNNDRKIMEILLIWPSPMLTYISHQYLDPFADAFLLYYAYQHIRTRAPIRATRHTERQRFRERVVLHTEIGIKKAHTHKNSNSRERRKKSQWTSPICCEQFGLPLEYSVLFIYVALLCLRFNGPVAVLARFTRFTLARIHR